MKKYRGFTEVEIYTLFEKLTCYGLDLLRDTIEAWQYNHDEDGSILKNLYNAAYKIREINEKYDSKEPEDLTRSLKIALKFLSDKELNYLIMLLELDPNDVFNNPYNNYGYYDEDDIEETNNAYSEIKDLVNKEKENRSMNNNINNNSNNNNNVNKKTHNYGNYSDVLFLRTNNTPSISKTPNIPNTNELFSKRFNKSKTLKRKKDSFRPYNL